MCPQLIFLPVISGGYYSNNHVMDFLRWYFAVISISGIFAVTFSVVFAYVADVTTEEDRSAAYGLVSASSLASLCISVHM